MHVPRADPHQYLTKDRIGVPCWIPWYQLLFSSSVFYHSFLLHFRRHCGIRKLTGQTRRSYERMKLSLLCLQENCDISGDLRTILFSSVQADEVFTFLYSILGVILSVVHLMPFHFHYCHSLLVSRRQPLKIWRKIVVSSVTLDVFPPAGTKVGDEWTGQLHVYHCSSQALGQHACAVKGSSYRICSH